MFSKVKSIDTAWGKQIQNIHVLTFRNTEVPFWKIKLANIKVLSVGTHQEGKLGDKGTIKAKLL